MQHVERAFDSIHGKPLTGAQYDKQFCKQLVDETNILRGSMQRDFISADMHIDGGNERFHRANNFVGWSQQCRHLHG